MPADGRCRGLGARVGAAALGRSWLAGIHPDDREGVSRAVADAVARGGRYECAFRIARPSGDVRWVQSYASPLEHPSGALGGYVGVVVDVTEQRRLEQRLAVSSRLSALGTLVAGVGHEINNPLAAVLASQGYVHDLIEELLRRLASAEPPAPVELAGELREALEPLRDAQASGKRIARIVRELAALSGPSGVREVVSLRAVVDAGLRWLPASIGRPDEVRVDDRGAPDVLGNRAQLSQVVLNLVSNACRAGRDGNHPAVTVRIRTGPQGRAVLEVEDDGVGMAPEVVRQLFDPFFTTRPTGQARGPGLGLPVCQSIVSGHGGTIEVRSHPGRGSTVTVELPPASGR